MVQSFLSKSLVKYVVVGMGSLAVDYAVLLALYRGAHVDVALASAAGFLVGLGINFVLNKYWSFDADRSAKQSAKQAIMYGALVAINLIFTSAFVAYMVRLHIGPEISKLITTAMVTLWNYVLYKKLIFKKLEPIA